MTDVSLYFQIDSKLCTTLPRFDQFYASLVIDRTLNQSFGPLKASLGRFITRRSEKKRTKKKQQPKETKTKKKHSSIKCYFNDKKVTYHNYR